MRTAILLAFQKVPAISTRPRFCFCHYPAEYHISELLSRCEIPEVRQDGILAENLLGNIFCARALDRVTSTFLLSDNPSLFAWTRSEVNNFLDSSPIYSLSHRRLPLGFRWLKLILSKRQRPLVNKLQTEISISAGRQSRGLQHLILAVIE